MHPTLQGKREYNPCCPAGSSNVVPSAVTPSIWQIVIRSHLNAQCCSFATLDHQNHKYGVDSMPCIKAETIYQC